MIHELLTGESAASEAVADCVAELETKTDAEVVVVVTPVADDHGDLAAAGASLVAFLTGLALLAGPWWIGEGWFLLDVAIVWFAANQVMRWPWFVRRVVPAARRDARLLRAARAAFVEESVHGTPHRTGILVYAAAAEDRILLLPDLGIEGRVPRAELMGIQARLDARGCEDLIGGLQALGEVLARRIPHTEVSDATDLPNAPRIHR